MTLTFHTPDDVAVGSDHKRRARVATSSPATETIAPGGTPATSNPLIPSRTSTEAAPAGKSPRPGSHLATLVTLMQAPDGATIDAMVEATGWQRHSVRGALAGALKTKYRMTITSAKTDGVRRYRIVDPAAAQ